MQVSIAGRRMAREVQQPAEEAAPSSAYQQKNEEKRRQPTNKKRQPNPGRRITNSHQVAPTAADTDTFTEASGFPGGQGRLRENG